MEISLIDLEDLEGTEGDWLIGEKGAVGPGDELDWLRRDLEESPSVAIKKKSLVNKLEDLARSKSAIWCHSLSLTDYRTKTGLILDGGELVL